jgi:ribosome recycling factor
MLIQKFKEQAKKLSEDFFNEILGFRTSRPTTALVDNIKVDCYGSLSPLKHVASVSIKLPNVIIIEPWDEGLITSVKKALEISSLGVTPSQEGKQIKLFLPPLSKERKNELVKLIGAKKEEYRVQLREIRDKLLGEVKQEFDKKEISEDEKFHSKEEIEKIVEQSNKTLDSQEKQKTDEILNS